MSILFLAAIIPAIFLITRVYRTDRLEKEPKGLLVKLVFMGIASTMLALVAELIGEVVLYIFIPEENIIYHFIRCFFIIGIAEESSKFLFLKWGSYKNSAFNCMFDGVVYAVTVALGFALLENIFYVLDGGFSTAILRAITAVPGHAVDGAFMGIWYGKAKQAQILGNKEEEKRNLRMAILVPAIIHGIYDFILFIDTENLLGNLLVLGVFIIYVIILFVTTIIITKRIAKNDFYIDKNTVDMYNNIGDQSPSNRYNSYNSNQYYNNSQTTNQDDDFSNDW